MKQVPVAITEEAWRAILNATNNPDEVAKGATKTGDGLYEIRLDADVHERLCGRMFVGETISDTILRIARCATGPLQ